jgi:hypothetical protein
MSRGFWAVIGGIAGFFAGGAAGLGLAAARFDCCYGESGYPVFGEIIGIVIGAGAVDSTPVELGWLASSGEPTRPSSRTRGGAWVNLGSCGRGKGSKETTSDRWASEKTEPGGCRFEPYLRSQSHFPASTYTDDAATVSIRLQPDDCAVRIAPATHRSAIRSGHRLSRRWAGV